MKTDSDIIERRSPEFDVTAILAGSRSLSDAMPELLGALCQGFGWQLGEAWLVVPHAGLIQLRHIWHATDLDAAKWEADFRSMAVQRGHGLVGRAWDRCEFQWTADMRCDPTFLRRECAAKISLRSVCAIPLCIDEQANGVITLLSRHVRKRDDAVVARLLALGEQIAGFSLSFSATHRDERYLGDLLDSAQDILAVLRVDGTIEYESLAVERILGYRREERIGRNVFDFVHPDDIPAAIDAFQSGVRSPGVAQTVEVRARHRDGSWIWLETVGALQETKSGLIAIAISRDVTHRKLQDSAGGATATRPAPVPLSAALTEPEERVLQLIARGLSNKEIAKSLNLSPHTVKEYAAKVCRKLGARNRVHAAALVAARDS